MTVYHLAAQNIRSSHRLTVLSLCLICFFITLHPASSHAAKMPGVPTAEQKVSEPKTIIPAGPVDEFNRGTPRSSIQGFLATVDAGDYEKAAQYLDLRNLPKRMPANGAELARNLKIILERALWIDIDTVSEHPKGNLDDSFPSYRDLLGRIKADTKTIDILIQRVPRGDGAHIWKISNKTIAHIPLLYKHHGYSKLEQFLEGRFPDVQFLGWYAWQWASYIVLALFSYLIAWFITVIIGYLVKKNSSDFSTELANYFYGPVRLSLWIVMSHSSLIMLSPSDSLRGIANASTLVYIIITWAVFRLVDLTVVWLSAFFQKQNRNAALILLKPSKTVLKLVIFLISILLWLDNLGFEVSTLLASMGIGGLAFALASQDMLKNLIGSIMILIDKPYEIGQRIIVKGYDGTVEEIGLRSTRIRLLTGNQVIIPNEDMARIDVENVGRRQYFFKRTDITLTLDTPVNKIEQAINIIKQHLENEENMDPSRPPKVFFNNINRDSVNIQVIFWHFADKSIEFHKFNQSLNFHIVSEFKAAGIKLALPSFNTYQPLEVSDLQSSDPFYTTPKPAGS